MAKIIGDFSASRRLSAGTAVNVPEWQPNTDYLERDMFIESGVQYIVLTGFTSGATFNASAPEIEVASGGAGDAASLTYDNSASGLTATTGQDAIDEVEGRVDSIETAQGVQDAAIALNTAKVSADGSVTSHSDVTDAGSGAIITVAERANIRPEEVVVNSGALSGAAPTGAKLGVDELTGTQYYINGGNWTAIPIANVDLNFTVSDETGGNGTGATTPSSPPTPTPDVGDVHKEIYDDVEIYFTAVAANWTTPAVTEIARDITTVGATDSDSGFNLVTNNGGVFADIDQNAIRVVPIAAAPVDGTTVSYYVGQLFWDNVNKNLYEATAKSTDPDSAGTGSTFAQVSLGGGIDDVLAVGQALTTNRTINLSGRSITLDGATPGKDITFDNGIVTLSALNRTTISATSGATNSPVITNDQVLEYNITNSTSGTVTMNTTTGGSANQVFVIVINNTDAVGRAVAWDAAGYADMGGQPLAETAIAAGETKKYVFVSGSPSLLIGDGGNSAENALVVTSNTLNSALLQSGVSGISAADYLQAVGGNLVIARVTDSAGTLATVQAQLTGLTSMSITNANGGVEQTLTTGTDTIPKGTYLLTYSGTTLTATRLSNEADSNVVASYDASFVTMLSTTLTNSQINAKEFLAFSTDNQLQTAVYDAPTVLDIVTDIGSITQIDLVDLTNGVTTLTSPADDAVVIGKGHYLVSLNGTTLTMRLVASASGSIFDTDGVIEDATNRIVELGTGAQISFRNDGSADLVARITDDGEFFGKAVRSAIESSIAVTATNELVGRSAGTNRQITVDASSTGTILVTMTGGGGFSEGEYLTIKLINSDTIARDVQFSGGQFLNYAGDADVGTITLQPATEQFFEFLGYDNTEARWMNAPEGAATAILFDSSAAADAKTLPAATGSGSVLFYANDDVSSNTASLAPQSGESLNGAVDGTFFASNYADGTQFVATDVAAGEWHVTVQGASADIERKVITHVEGAIINVVSNDDNDFEVVDISALIAETTNPDYNVDPVNNVFGTGFSINASGLVVPAGRWTVEFDIEHPATTLTGGGSVQLDVGLFAAGISVGGPAGSVDFTSALAYATDSGLPERASVTYDLYLKKDTEVYFGYRGAVDAADNEAFALRIDVYSNEPSEVALAGMVEPTDLSIVGLFGNEVPVIFEGYEFRAVQSSQEFQMRVTSGSKIITGFTSYDTGVSGQSTDDRSLTLDTNWTTVWTDGTLNMPDIGDFQRLFWNDGTNNYEFRGIVGSGYNNNFIEIRRLNQQEVVTKGSVPVEDVRVELGSATVSDGQNVTISTTWADVVANYEKVEFHFDFGNRKDGKIIETVGWTDPTDVQVFSDGVEAFSLTSMSFTGNTATYSEVGTTFNTATVRIYGIKAQKTVINTTDLTVDDQASSSYFDFGTMRMQWGTNTEGVGTRTITFPAAFADTAYTLTTSAKFPITAGTTFSIAFSESTSSRTTTGTGGELVFADASTSGQAAEQFDWIAIGLKP